MAGVVVRQEHPYRLVEPVDVPLPVGQARVFGDEPGVSAGARREVEQERVGGLDGFAVSQDEHAVSVMQGEDDFQGAGRAV
jgi:hypothetical protein